VAQLSQSSDPGTLAEAQGAAAIPCLEQFRAYLRLVARLEMGRHAAARFDPSDVVQETFLRATRDLPGFRGHTEGELVVWLRAILAHTMADECRRLTGRPNPVLEVELAGALERSSQALEGLLGQTASTPSQQASRRERAVLLANALEQLPEHYREVLILHQLEDFSFPEVAQRMGRTLDSVKNMWIRAVVALRQNYIGGSP
jgi:RNA polymerase sigma-70 factor, ECF subfamily